MAKTAKMLKKQQAKDSKDLTKNETSVAIGDEAAGPRDAKLSGLLRLLKRYENLKAPARHQNKKSRQQKVQTRQKRDMADLGNLAMSENDVGDFYRLTAAKEAILASKLKI